MLAVAEAIGQVIGIEKLRYVAFSHYEADECGSLNDFLAAAPQAEPVCSRVAAMVSVNDVASRPARALADGEVLRTGRHALKWLDAPHVPHAWENGFMMELETRTLLCGDLFTQGGSGAAAREEPQVLACMHGSAWRGDGASLLRALARALTRAHHVQRPEVELDSGAVPIASVSTANAAAPGPRA